MSADLTREDVVKAARDAQRDCNGPLTRTDFIRITGISEWVINRLFPEGRWTEIRSLAGIQRHPLDRREYSDEELLTEFHRVVEELGEIPTWAIFSDRANISRETLTRRFGGLRGTLKAYADWLEQKYPNSPLLNSLRNQSKHEVPAPPQILQGAQTSSSRRWQQTDGTVFGAPIDFRGLRHAPINEQGVVYLFGIVSFELGFIVEAVHAAYPDCEAKRQIGKDRWQRVRIEFEYKSSNFRDHGHDPAGADLIVCWEHNWADCPLEVLELRKAIDNLDA